MNWLSFFNDHKMQRPSLVIPAPFAPDVEVVFPLSAGGSPPQARIKMTFLPVTSCLVFQKNGNGASEWS